ncbi:hypothetical protein BT96DRAFT_1006903 [Gymnopus androsaceus JB14]|uniref:Uncharacterized protein n=1 Tax=Gymnopus androsaceus JB14 TaxID=1447944 RepID=A0A6A4GIU1_9AGAR|nr:hypothetical protein BT96DRAFT_1006903 [Gymnopus androsaceus JB14]
MPTNLSPETVMSTVPSPETVTISTFALPSPAPPPLVVPLFSTTVQSRRRTLLAIHENLDSKPRLYHPYPQTKRSMPAASTSSTSPDPKAMPSTSSPKSSSTSLEPEPGSPLTPITEEFPADASHRQMEPRMILAPPPNGTLVFSKLELAEAVARDYHLIAKRAIQELNLDIQRSLSDQDPQSRNTAWT